MFNEKEKEQVRINLTHELNIYLKNRWNNLSDDTKRCLGLNIQSSKDMVFLIWTGQFYIERIVKLEEVLGEWKQVRGCGNGRIKKDN